VSSAVDVWGGVDRLVDRAPDLADLRAHRLHLLAGRRLRARGLPVPETLVAEERASAAFSLGTPLALELLRASCEGPIVVLKGPELAARYPAPHLRPATDVDVLVEDANDAQQRARRAGFVPLDEREGYYEPLHHLPPLWHPAFGVKLEIHRRPEWVSWSSPPPAEELLDIAVPAAVGVDGISALPAAEHALVVAAHSWSNLPLRRLLDLVDLQVLAGEAGRTRVVELAARWDLVGVWRTMIEAADALLDGGPRTLPLRTWARDLVAVREPTVAATHFRRLAGPVWALPARRAAFAIFAALAREVRPAADESWSAKRIRSVRAIRNAFRRRSEHERTLWRRE